MSQATRILSAIWRSVGTLIAVFLIIVTLLLGIWIGRAPIRAAARAQAQAETTAADGEGRIQEYTCSMHPQIRLRDPKAKCPICFMDLIPVTDDGGTGGERSLVMSEAALRLAEIQTTPVVRRFPAAQVRLVGRIEYDETRTAAITAWFPGRIERLFINFTGATVQRGQPVAEIYSPELLAVQEELRQAITSLRQVEGGSPLVREASQATVQAARDRLRLIGLTDQQIREIETADQPLERLTIHAPISGTVIRREALQGDYVETGQELFAIADLSQVWVRLEAFESQLPYFRYGQEVTFTTDGFPAQQFQGRIAFIDPSLAAERRTLLLRVNAPNPAGLLKPGMFVRATVRARLAADGSIISDELAGRWISPLHPEIIQDEPGTSPVSGEQLVRAESLGYVTSLANAEPPLVISASAPLITGRRAVVYVQDTTAEQPTFEGREVTLGPRAGDWYIVASGLREGEHVVTNGAFKIDSAMQIVAKPSMMSSSGDAASGHHHSAFRARVSSQIAQPTEAFLFSLKPVYAAYLEVQEALAADDFPRFQVAAGDLSRSIGRVRTQGMVGEGLGLWRRLESRLRSASEHLPHASDIEAARRQFEPLSRATLELAQTFGHLGTEAYYRAHCPMAFDDTGADWLQRGREINNPYFGAMMLRCGEIRATFPPRGQGEIQQ